MSLDLIARHQSQRWTQVSPTCATKDVSLQVLSWVCDEITAKASVAAVFKLKNNEIKIIFFTSTHLTNNKTGGQKPGVLLHNVFFSMLLELAQNWHLLFIISLI